MSYSNIKLIIMINQNLNGQKIKNKKTEAVFLLIHQCILDIALEKIS